MEKYQLAMTVAALLLTSGAAYANPALDKKSGCHDCHHIDKSVVGPSYQKIAQKYKGDAKAEAKLIEKVRKGGSGVWGDLPMTADPDIKDEDIKTLVKWILSMGDGHAAPSK